MFFEQQIMPMNASVGSEAGNKIAINCTSYIRPLIAAGEVPIFGAQRLSDGVHALISNSLSEATRRAYRSDMAHYEAWGGSLPAAPETVAEYLAGMAEAHAMATISRRLASLAKAHRASGSDPTKAEIVKSTMRGIRRMLGTAQREAKPILKEDLFQMLSHIDDSPKGRRDRALLLLGFAGAFRRSELVGLDVADIEHVRQGIIVTLRRSKTDQFGAGRKIGIPFGRSRWCPVKHLRDWLDNAGIENGPIFRSINRHGHVAAQRLSGDAVSIIVKERTEKGGFASDGYSGHSLRAGFATSAVIAGAPSFKIRAQTGHASDAMLERYIRDSDMFSGNAAGVVL